MSRRSEALAAVHTTAAGGAATVAVLPIGADVIALRTEETAMVMYVGSLYSETLTKAAAKGLLASGFAQMAGETVALTALEVANATGFFAWAIKAGVASGLIEAVGHCAVDYFEDLHGGDN